MWLYGSVRFAGGTVLMGIVELGGSIETDIDFNIDNYD